MKYLLLLLLIVVIMFFNFGCDSLFTDFNIGECFWENKVDTDQDGYASKGDLVIEINANSFGQGSEPIIVKQVYIKLYVKKSDTDNWTLKMEIPRDDIGKINLHGAGERLDHGQYNFKFTVQIVGEKGYSWVKTLEPANDTDLANQNFETEADDK